MDPKLDAIMTNGHEPDPAGAEDFLSATERDQMLKVSKGDQPLVEPERRSSHKVSKTCRVKEELNEVVFWKFRMWMILIFISVLIVAVILISLALCSLVYKDKDEQFDASTFNVSRLFNGTFRMQSPALSEGVAVAASNQSQALTSRLQDQLEDLYKSSPALGRYFSSAEVAPLRKDPAVAEFRLKFLMPAGQRGQLRKFTLSREMIYNVLRQFLYEQPSLRIEPASLELA
ncbi:TPA-induced transmembrane protein homolog [Neosynchiropus ocellatus]